MHQIIRARGREGRCCISTVPSSEISNPTLQHYPHRPFQPPVQAVQALPPVMAAYRLPHELMLLVQTQQSLNVGAHEGGRTIALLHHRTKVLHHRTKPWRSAFVYRSARL